MLLLLVNFHKSFESQTQDSDFPDDEEYSTEAGVYRAMCREGLIEEFTCIDFHKIMFYEI